MRIYLSVLLILVVCIGCNNSINRQKNKVENITAFAKLYGYVRWFHPSDEAQQINWDLFACYGVKTVENAPNSGALKDSLLKLFLPIAPTLEIYNRSEQIYFDISKIYPSDTTGFFPVYWQHYGVGMEFTPMDIYSSLRINRVDNTKVLNSCPVPKIIDASKYRGKTIELSFFVKSAKGSKGNIFFETIKSADLPRSFDHPKTVSGNNNNWEKVKIKRFVDINDELILIGFNNQSNTPVLFDSIKLVVKHPVIPDSIIYENNLDNSQTAFSGDGFDKFPNLPFNLELVSDSPKADSCLSISYNQNFRMFEQAPKPGETINEQIHAGLMIRLPLILMSNDHHTFPVSAKESLSSLKYELSQWQPQIYKDLGSLVIVWNIIQHFFPYFDEVEVDWIKEFSVAVNNVYSGEEFDRNLKMLMATLKDGHIYVNPSAYKHVNALPLKWEWIEDKLVITEVYDKSAGHVAGAFVHKIAGQKAEDYFSAIESCIPAATIGALKKGSEFLSLLGTPGDSTRLDVTQVDGSKRKLNLKYSLPPHDNLNRSLNRTRYKILGDDIYYLNLDQVTRTEIDSMLPDLVKCKGIICDLRGYPNNNHEILNHLLTLNDTVDNWFRIPQIIYPDQKNISYDGRGWNMIPREPRIHAPVVFIADSRAISYAESVLMIVKHYKLATIVGQPSAGTNGNVNELILPNGFKTRFTGMKAVNGDGSQHFGIGVLPDVYVEKTISGVLEGRDEYLEKALEVIKGYQ